MSKFIFFVLFFLFSAVLEAKAPLLTQKEVRKKVEELLGLHVSHKKLSPEIIRRGLINFLEELDPIKGYFLEDEVAQWTTPSDELLGQCLEQCKRGEYSVFRQIYDLFERAIQRRNQIELELERVELFKDVKSEEFKDLPYAKTREELLTRLGRIRSLQAEMAERWDEEKQGFFLQRLRKRRLSREGELFSLEEREGYFCSFVLKALAAALDAHTNYFTPSEANQFIIQVQQKLSGIGAQLRDSLDGLVIARILEHSPAEASKLKVNDKIIAVNGEPIMGMDFLEAVDLIRGEKGSGVTLTVQREAGETFDVELIRNEIVLEESRLETKTEPFGDGVIACLRLYSFYQDKESSSASDIRKAVEKIKRENTLHGVILDLRGNAGGLLPQAVLVTGLFIKRGIVVSLQEGGGHLQHQREVEGNPVWDGPLIVLVDRASASAAEIVAQTLQDYGRALVVGDPHTFGKGTVQTFSLDPGRSAKVNPQGEYKVTRGRYFTVSGKSPQLTGVCSDVVVPGPLFNLDIGEEFTKFPLGNEEIEPHFEDTLSDLSPLHRLELGPFYRYQLQEKLSLYTKHLEVLRKNSEVRMAENRLYKEFLEDAQNKKFDSEAVETFGRSNLQMNEAFNVMKDLIFLVQFKRA